MVTRRSFGYTKKIKISHLISLFSSQHIKAQQPPMAKPSTLQSWLNKAPQEAPQPTKPTTKRPIKRKSGPSTSDSVFKTPAPAPKKSKTTPKKLTRPAPTKSDAKKLYKSTIEGIHKTSVGLDKRVKSVGPNSRAVMSDTYAQAMEKYVKGPRS
jgi:hypothetical protein